MANDIVIFLDAQGNEVSNDPRWIAEQTVRSFEDTVDDPDGESGSVAYSDRDGKWLKKEVKKRQEAGRDIDTTGVTKKAELITLLETDDEAVNQERLAAAGGGTSPEEEEADEDDSE